MNKFCLDYLTLVSEVSSHINIPDVEKVVQILKKCKDRGGRLFLLGVGGSAGNASHAVNDFRKLCDLDAHTFENISELTARINDEGWNTCYSNWLKAHFLNPVDTIMVLSVGGGSEEKQVSVNLVAALIYAQHIGCDIVGIVGRDGGYTKKVASACIVVPPINPNMVTPITESFQSVLLHLMVTHPSLVENKCKWESV